MAAPCGEFQAILTKSGNLRNPHRGIQLDATLQLDANTSSRAGTPRRLHHPLRCDGICGIRSLLIEAQGRRHEWGEESSRKAHAYLQALTAKEREELQETILCGLPGGNGSYTLQEVRDLVVEYAEVDESGFRQNAAEFLRLICPVAAELGVRLCIHPDDQPRPLLGLPRIVSTADDLEWLMAQSDLDANGLTFCTGALGVRADNDLTAMVRRFAPRIGFFHLRSTQREEKLKMGAA
jgi:mannonate dehydratase